MITKNNLQFYCIHHYLANDRKIYIIDKIKNKDIIWIENYKPECKFIQNHVKIYNQHSANHNYLNKAELSCYYKHYLAIRHISESGIDGVIFEDDIACPNFDFTIITQKLHNLMIQKNCDILFIGSFGNNDLRFNYPTIVMNNNTKSRCAHCYIVRSNIASKLANYLSNIIAPLDWQLNYAIDNLSLNSGWSYPHIYQRTEKNQIKSLLR